LSGLDDDAMSEIALNVAKLGETVAVHDEISVVEVAVDNDQLSQPPLEKLTDATDTIFYDHNKRELESLVPDRVAEAARRLAEAEPKLYRDDISQRLLAVMDEGGSDAAAAAARA